MSPKTVLLVIVGSFVLPSETSQALSRGQQWVQSHPFTINAVQSGDFNSYIYMQEEFSSTIGYMYTTNMYYNFFLTSSINGLGWHWFTSTTDNQTIMDNVTFLLSNYDNASLHLGYGFCIGDESDPSIFDNLSKVLTGVRNNAANSLVYHAMRGMDYGGMYNISTYSQYVDSVINDLNPDILMYDLYPFYNNSLSPNYYYNLGVIRNKAKCAGLPYWNFLQSFGTSNNVFQEPSESQMRFQAFVSLAYGYTGLSYWTYTVIDSNMTNALLDRDYYDTHMYWSVKALVPEVKRIGEITKSLTSIGVYYKSGTETISGDAVPAWSSSADPFMKAVTVNSGRGFLITFFKNDSGDTYFMLVNCNRPTVRDPSNPFDNATWAASVTVDFDHCVSKLERLNRQTGNYDELTLSNNQLVNYCLPGGTGDLFRYKFTGAAKYQFPVTFTTNPTSEWSLKYGPRSWTSVDQLTAMDLIASTVWRKNVGGQWQPSYNYSGDSCFCTTGWSAGTDAAVCAFQAPQTGNYSILMRWDSIGTGADATVSNLNVRTAPDNSTPGPVLWSTTHSFSTGSTATVSDDLSAVPALQNIHMVAGSYIIFSMHVGQDPGYPACLFRFHNPVTGAYGGSIAFVPETATVKSLPTSFTTNPTNEWSLEYASPGWSTVSNLYPMVLITGTTDRWRYSNSLSPWQPSYNYYGTSFLRAVSWPGGSEMRNAGIILFQAPQTGYYNIQVDWRSYGTGSAYTTEYLSVRTAPNVSTPAAVLWSTQHYFSTGSYAVVSDNLATIPALQDIYLTSGSYILFSMNVQETPNEYPMLDTKYYLPNGIAAGGNIIFFTCP